MGFIMNDQFNKILITAVVSLYLYGGYYLAVELIERFL